MYPNVQKSGFQCSKHVHVQFDDIMSGLIFIIIGRCLCENLCEIYVYVDVQHLDIRTSKQYKA